RQLQLTNLTTQEQTILPDEDIRATAFLPDGGSFLAAHGDGRVTEWQAGPVKMAREVRTAGEGLGPVHVSPEGRHAAIGGVNGLAQILDVATGTVDQDLSQSGTPTNCIRYSPDGTELAIASGDWNATDAGKVSVWNLNSREVTNRFDFSGVSPG